MHGFSSRIVNYKVESAEKYAAINISQNEKVTDVKPKYVFCLYKHRYHLVLERKQVTHFIRTELMIKTHQLL
mgnify:FL=1